MKISELLENLTEYPEIVSADFIYDMVRKLHHNEEDFSEGDLANRIYQYKNYKLMLLPIDKLNAEEFDTIPEYVSDYKKLTTKIPPIVVQANKKRIIDGTHRTQAMIALGHKTILAYVGNKN